MNFDEKVQAMETITHAAPEAKPVAETKAVAQVEMEEKKTPRNTGLKVVQYLTGKYSWRFNELLGDVEYRNGVGGWRTFDDRTMRKIRYDLDLNQGLIISAERFMNILYGGISVDYNPLTDYLARLPEYDGADYIGRYAEQIKLVDERKREYLVDVFTRWLVGMVATWTQALSVNQLMLILCGPQGRFKTTFLNNLIPGELQLQYLYCGKFNASNKDHELYLATKLLINLDELATFGRMDVESLKSVITQPTISVRKPYDRRPTELFRKASFCGSINRREFLTDTTGNRRFVVIDVRDIELSDAVTLEQLYSHALYLLRNNFQWWMSRDKQLEVEVESEQFRSVSMEEQIINELYRVPTSDEMRIGLNIKLLNATQIADAVGDTFKKYHLTDYSAKRIGEVMSRMGFPTKLHAKHVGANRTKHYIVRILSAEDIAGEATDAI